MGFRKEGTESLKQEEKKLFIIIISFGLGRNGRNKHGSGGEFYKEYLFYTKRSGAIKCVGVGGADIITIML